MRFVPIKDEALKKAGVFHTASTLRSRHRYSHPHWFKKIGGRIFLDTEAYFGDARPVPEAIKQDDDSIVFGD